MSLHLLLEMILPDVDSLGFEASPQTDNDVKENINLLQHEKKEGEQRFL